MFQYLLFYIIPYFIRSVFTTDPYKKASHPSLLLHFIIPLIIECVVIVGFIYRFHNYSAWFLPLVLPLAIILLFDAANIFRRCICIDLRMWFAYDSNFTDVRYHHDVAYFEEMFAHIKFEQWGNNQCPICRDYYSNEIIATEKQILQCGHLYHKKCLENCENYQWNNNNWVQNTGICYMDRTEYEIGITKFDYNPNYNIPWFQRDPQYPLKTRLDNFLWEPIQNVYDANKAQLRTHYQQRYRHTHANCTVSYLC
eukprot:336158_1